MIEGASIRLRAWQERDLPTLQGLRNDVALQAQLLARARGSDIAQVRDWLERRSNGTDSVLFVIADRHADEALGFIQFTGLDPIDRLADLGICLSPTAQGRGAGTQAITLALPYLREVRRTRKLSLRVRSDNERAIHCYQRLGFQQCGHLRKHTFIDGRWQDVLLMEIFLEHG
jgi:RimJ/RimL family protein N-acetyltransferase